MNLESLEVISMGQEEAREKWREYVGGSMEYKSKEYQELKGIYYQLAKGRRLIDIPNSIFKAGLNSETHLPKLGLANANSPACWLKIHDSWGRAFARFASDERTAAWGSRFTNHYIDVPFDFPRDEQKKVLVDIRRNYRAPMPLIPPEVASKLKNGELTNPAYYVLWEVEKWELVAPRDPILLRRFSKNLFIIIDKWNLTKLERMVAQGRLG